MGLNPRFTIGIDAGGTYTDAVVIDLSENKVVAKAKSITTKADLAIGVERSLKLVLASANHIRPEDFQALSVSTTLATNAVVEGHTDPVVAILIGFDDVMVEKSRLSQLGEVSILRVSGGHAHTGDERQPLNEEGLRQSVADLCHSTAKIAAVSISSTFAVRNRSHELRAAEIVAELLGVPATMSADLSSSLDAPRRALTAALNAQLVGRITRLADAVARAADSCGLRCPQHLVKGDGTRALASSVRLRPIETIMSGPAASLIGAAWLSGRADLIMADIGGTTTDIATLRNGRPTLSPGGARVGGWHTMVEAIDVSTFGLGGDSAVRPRLAGSLKSGTAAQKSSKFAVDLGPARVVPLSVLADHFPPVIATLASQLGAETTRESAGKFLLPQFGVDKANSAVNQSETFTTFNQIEREVIDLVGNSPVALTEIETTARRASAVARLVRLGVLQYAGFTPTDAAHVLGHQDNFDLSAARLGAAIGAKLSTVSTPTEAEIVGFAEAVYEETIASSAKCFLDATADMAMFATAGCDSEIWNKIARTPSDQIPTFGVVGLRASVAIPLAGVGAAARVFYPEAAKRFGAELLLMPHGDVANAIGAAVGLISKSAEALINGNGAGLFIAHAPHAKADFTDLNKAVAWARTGLSNYLISVLNEMGATAPVLSEEQEKVTMSDDMGDLGLLSLKLTMTGTGWPC